MTGNSAVNARWQETKGRCISDGAGVTGVVVLDGIPFSLGGQTKLPAQTTVMPNDAVAAWMQNDPFTLTGYPE